jgi:hypothetical protein
MHRVGNGYSAALALVATGAIFWSVAAPAAADRGPSKAEARAIKRVALKKCGAPDCRFRHARISTENARFAWAEVVGEGFSGVLVKRPTRSSRRFRVVGSQGGGIGSCDYWRARAPAAVLRDLRIAGVVDDSGTTRNCGKRR